MTSVPQARHVQDVFLNTTQGLLACRPKQGRKTLFLELSTIDAHVSSQIADTITSGGWGEFVDAPCSVSGLGINVCRVRGHLAHRTNREAPWELRVEVYPS